MSATDDITLPQAAREIGISWASAWRLLLTGRLEGRLLHGRWIVTRSSLDSEKLRRLRTAAGMSRLRAGDSDGCE
jgi:hypothetical protein